jgi:RNA polymerase sigma factor (sigma-70 family)
LTGGGRRAVSSVPARELAFGGASVSAVLEERKMESRTTTQQKYRQHHRPCGRPRDTPRAESPGRHAGDEEARASPAVPEVLVLWRRCATASSDGDWLDLHRRLGARIRGFLRQGLAGRYRLACPAEAEDLEQEVYCRLIAHDRRGIRRCRAATEDELVGYLLRICRSVLSSAVRRSCARKRRPVPALEGLWREVEPDEVAAPELSPEDRAVISDARRKATACAVHGSPAAARRQRLVLQHVLYHGYTSAEVAPALGVTASAVDSLVTRARRRAHARGVPFPRRPSRACRARPPA